MQGYASFSLSLFSDPKIRSRFHPMQRTKHFISKVEVLHRQDVLSRIKVKKALNFGLI